MVFDRKEYIRNYQREWIKKRRLAWVHQNGPCRHCGSWERLQVDHIDHRTKALNPKALWSLSPQNPIRIAELAKCQVLCFDCHQGKSTETRARGERHGQSVLIETQIHEIRVLLRKGFTQASIAQQFGVHRSTISDIKHNRKWRHL